MIYYLFFPAGGIGKYSDRLVQELIDDESINLEVVCPPDFQWRDNGQYRIWPGLFRISSRVPLVRKIRFLLGQFFSPWRLLKRAKETGAHMVHLANINYLTFPFWHGALKRWGGHLVCTAHDVQRGRYVLSKSWGERQLKAVYRACDAIFVHSDEQADELVAFAGVDAKRIHQVPHGPTQYGQASVNDVDALRGRYAVAADEKLALCFGFLRPQKNLEGLIRAMALLGDSDLRLCIVGNAPPGGEALVARCRTLIEELELEDRVRLDVRFVPDEVVPALISLCDFLVLPYRDDFSSQSGVLNLAAYYERPVLATPTASLKAALVEEPIGLLCEGFDEAHIQQGLTVMTSKCLEANSWPFERYRKRNSWQRNAQQTIEVYRKLWGQAT